MQRHLRTGLLAFAVTALPGVVLAADMAPRSYTKAAVDPAYNWSGWYVGLNAGWAGIADPNIPITGTDTGTGGLGDRLNTGSIPSNYRLNNTGFAGGGQFGYNVQAGAIVYGFEADLQGASAKKNLAFAATALPLTTTVSRSLDWFGTARGRIGFTPSDRSLFYVTGGFAYGASRVSVSSVDILTAVPPLNASASNSFAVGYAAGAGFEWAFMGNWSVKGEYLYMSLRNSTPTITYSYPPDSSSLTAHSKDAYSIASIGLNYKFGGPVVARY